MARITSGVKFAPNPGNTSAGSYRPSQRQTLSNSFPVFANAPLINHTLPT